jgi:predicted CopG family antitoxin
MVKTISITNEVYNLLSNMKLEGESFSDTIARLATRGAISDCAGLWSDMSADELNEIKEGIKAARKAIEKRLQGATT